MTPLDVRSLLRGGAFLLALSLFRFGLEQVGTRTTVLPQGPEILPSLMEESLKAATSRRQRSTPLAPGETLDPNRCGEEDFDRLPGIGPATARALVADREENGGFKNPQDLLRVSGIGPVKLANIQGFLEFSSGIPVELLRKSSSRADTRSRSGIARVDRVDLNRASAEELQTLPGIGPTLARRIVESRSNEGPFGVMDDLLRVRGIGPSVLARLRTLVDPGG